MFVNPEVPIESLPGAVRLDWLALDPRFVRRWQVGVLVRWIVIVAVCVGGNVAYVVMDAVEVHLAVIVVGWSVLVLVAAVSLVWPLVAVPRRGYVVRDKDIVYRTGVVWRSVKAVPYGRVQHAQTASGPIDRRFGLARITVFTAGGGGYDLRIDGLASEVAERLRTHILGKLGDPSPPEEPAGEGTNTVNLV